MNFAWFSMGYRFVVKPVYCRSVRAVIRWQTVPLPVADNPIQAHLFPSVPAASRPAVTPSCCN